MRNIGRYVKCTYERWARWESGRGSSILVWVSHGRDVSRPWESWRVGSRSGSWRLSVGLSIRCSRFASGSSRFFSGSKSVLVLKRRSGPWGRGHVRRWPIRSSIRPGSCAIAMFAVQSHRRSRRIVLVADVNDKIAVTLVSGVVILKLKERKKLLKAFSNFKWKFKVYILVIEAVCSRYRLGVKCAYNFISTLMTPMLPCNLSLRKHLKTRRCKRGYFGQL